MAIFTSKTTNQIVNSILVDIVTNVPSITDVNPGSVLRQLVEATGLEINTLYTQLQNIYDGTRILTATGSDLENLGALVGITRKPGIEATGFVTFSRLTPSGVNFVIPGATIISTQPNTGEDQLRFTVDANTTFLATIAGETHTFIDGFYNYALDERFINSVSSLTGFSLTLPFVFTQGTDFNITNDYDDTIVDPDSVVAANDCDAITGWTNSVDADAVTVDVVNFKQGTGSLNLGKSGITTVNATYSNSVSPVINVENLKLFIWVYIDDLTTLNKVNFVDFYFGNTGIANSFKMTKNQADLVVGWQQILLNPFDFDTVITGVPNSSIIDFIRMDINVNTITDIFTLGKIKMDFWAFGADEDYEGDVITWDQTGTLPDTSSIWTIDYVPLSKEVLCTAEEVGIAYNVGRHKIIFKVSNVSNIDNVENFVAMQGGVDEETDDELRSRIQLAAEVVGNATVLALQQAVLGVNGVTSVSVDDTPNRTSADEPHIYDSGITDYKLDNEVTNDDATLKISDTISGPADYINGVDYVLVDSTIVWLGFSTPTGGNTFYVTYDYEWLGHVHIFVAGSVTPLSLAVITNIETAIEETRAAGIVVTFSEPTPVVIDVTCVLTIDTVNGFTFTAVKEQVESALITFINALGVGKDVFIAELYFTIQNVAGVLNSSISVPAADVVIAITDRGIAGTILIT